MPDAVSPALIAAFGSGSSASRASFLSTLHAACRDLGWKPGAFRAPDRPMSFEWLELLTPDSQHALLLDLDGRVAALTRTAPAFGRLDFADSDLLEPILALHSGANGPSTVLLSRATLTADLRPADLVMLRALGPHMAHNLDYWRPSTVGEVIFNYWD